MIGQPPTFGAGGGSWSGGGRKRLNSGHPRYVNTGLNTPLGASGGDGIGPTSFTETLLAGSLFSRSLAPQPGPVAAVGGSAWRLLLFRFQLQVAQPLKHGPDHAAVLLGLDAAGRVQDRATRADP